MIKLEINSQKELSVTKKTKVFKGENLINSFEITAVNPSVGNKRVEDCDFFLHVVLPDDSFIAYPVEWSPNSIPLTGFVPITYDITADAQILRLYIEIKSENTVIGKSNTVELQVFDSPNEVTGITPREQLEEELASAATLTETLEALKGTYDSVPERLAADEAQLSSNTAGLSACQSLLVSHAAALGNKLDDADNEINTNHITDGAVTNTKLASGAVTQAKLADSSVTGTKINNGAVITAKIADGAVTNSKLDSSLQAIIGRVPTTPMSYSSLGIQNASDYFDKSYLCKPEAEYHIQVDGPLAISIGVPVQTLCILKYIESYDNDPKGYQLLEIPLTNQIFYRAIHVVTPFVAGNWIEAVSPRIISLETTVGTLNSQLENALNGGA